MSVLVNENEVIKLNIIQVIITLIALDITDKWPLILIHYIDTLHREYIID